MLGCYYCKKRGDQVDLRPYGPKGALVCFDCAMATPERRAEAEQNFTQQLGAAGPVAVVGSEVGPYPAEHHPDLRENPVPPYFGHGCQHFSGEWERDADRDRDTPVLTYCSHGGNRSHSEGNCEPKLCPLLRERPKGKLDVGPE